MSTPPVAPGHFHTAELLCTSACPAYRSPQQRIRALEAAGARLCVRPGSTLTTADLDTAEWFTAWLKAPGHVPFTGCERCERVTSLDLEPGQVASCGQHSYVRKGEPR